MKANLIRCPHCEENGKHSTLGELSPTTGMVIIARSAGQFRNYTIVSGNDFQLICGECGKVVFIRKEVNGLQVFNYRVTRFRGEIPHPGFGTAGMWGNTAAEGVTITFWIT